MNLEIWNNQKKYKTRELRKIIKNAINLTLLNTDTGKLVDEMKLIPVFSVTLTDNIRIKKINSEYRNIDRETDVISFPAVESEGDILKSLPDLLVYEENGKKKINFGDIVISLEKAMEQSIMYEQSFEREVFFLTVHSVLHLFGYDHDNKMNESIMIEKQKQIMKTAMEIIIK